MGSSVVLKEVAVDNLLQVSISRSAFRQERLDTADGALHLPVAPRMVRGTEDVVDSPLLAHLPDIGVDEVTSVVREDLKRGAVHTDGLLQHLGYRRAVGFLGDATHVVPQPCRAQLTCP